MRVSYRNCSLTRNRATDNEGNEASFYALADFS